MFNRKKLAFKTFIFLKRGEWQELLGWFCTLYYRKTCQAPSKDFSMLFPHLLFPNHPVFSHVSLNWDFCTGHKDDQVKVKMTPPLPSKILKELFKDLNKWTWIYSCLKSWFMEWKLVNHPAILLVTIWFWWILVSLNKEVLLYKEIYMTKWKSYKTMALVIGHGSGVLIKKMSLTCSSRVRIAVRCPISLWYNMLSTCPFSATFSLTHAHATHTYKLKILRNAMPIS